MAKTLAYKTACTMFDEWFHVHPEFEPTPENQKRLMDLAIPLAGGCILEVRKGTMDRAYEELRGANING